MVDTGAGWMSPSEIVGNFMGLFHQVKKILHQSLTLPVSKLQKYLEILPLSPESCSLWSGIE